jgi:hypothetical protein
MTRDRDDAIPGVVAKFLVGQIGPDRSKPYASRLREPLRFREADRRRIDGDYLEALLREEAGISTLALGETQHASAPRQGANVLAQKVVR